MRIAPLAALVALAAILGYPLRHAAPFHDDFLFIALARHVERPWELLYRDAIGSYFFRPAGMALWWVSERIAAGNLALHYAVNLVLHALNGWALGLLCARLGIRRSIAFGIAALFVASPAAFSASAWLSDRFDLLATLFMMLALAAFAARSRRLLVLFAVLAMLSKESAYILPILVFVLAWVERSGPDTLFAARLRLAFLDALPVIAIAAVLLFVRFLLLRGTEAALFSEGLAATLAGGVAGAWRAAAYVLFPTWGNPIAVTLWKGVNVLAVALVVGALVARGSGAGIMRRAAGLGVAMIVFAILVQAPVLNATGVAPHADRLEAGTVTASRLFYVASAGLGLCLAACAESLMRAFAGKRPLPAALAVLLAAGLVSAGVISRAVAREWTAETLRADAIAAAAHAAVAQAAPASGPCKVYLLDTRTRSPTFDGFADAAVKSRMPRGSLLMRCFVQTEAAPWFHLLPGDAVGFEDALPLRPMAFAGKPLPPLHIGGLTYLYLEIPAVPEIAADPAARFLRYDAGRFVDVTPEVRSGARTPRFIQNRPFK